MNICLMEIKTETIVWLKSGSPKMTSTKIGQYIVCNWFDGGQVTELGFLLEQLTIENPETNKAAK